MPGDFTAKKGSKGRITNVRTGFSLRFTINPHTIKVKGGANISEDPIPGFSSPLLRYASGKTKVYSFQLEVDGEITNRHFGIQLGNNVHADRPLDGYSIAGELEWYESLTLPADPNVSDGGLDRVLITVGSYIPGVVCFVESADPTVTEWDTNYDPTKAKIDMVLKRVDDTNVFSNQVWDVYRGPGPGY